MLAAATCLALVTGISAALMTFRLANANHWVKHTLVVINIADDLVGLLQSAETAHRGYLLIGNEEFLAPYKAALEQIESRFRELKGLTSNNAEQQRRLEKIASLVSEKIKEFEETISLAKNGQRERSLQIVGSAMGNALTRDIRALMEEFSQTELGFLLNRERTSDRYNILLTVLIFLSLGAATSIVVLAFYSQSRLLSQLSRFVEDRAKMLAALSHDLRTPITSLRLHAEFIEEAETRAKISETLDEMQQMAEATLLFAREEASREQARLVDLGALVSSVCSELVGAGRHVLYQDTGDFKLCCRPVGVKRALRNIVENAVFYGKCARVSVFLEDSQVAIVVDDDGPGIPEEDFEKVFKPFVRLESSRSRETGGVGLGLSIASSIIRSHGGDIFLKNRAGGGLRVTLTLPSESHEQLLPSRHFAHERAKSLLI